jgi:chaperonin GroES
MSDSIFMGNRKLIVTGDRVLISPPSSGERTDSGLYVPDSAADSRKVMGGWVEAVGPGYPVPSDPGMSSDEPWREASSPSMKYFPLQVEKGDFVLFVKNSSWEIRLDSGKYFVVPFSGILVILRTPLDINDQG